MTKKLIIATLVLAIGFASAAGARDVDWTHYKVAHLMPHIGTSNYGPVLNDPTVKAALERQVGADLPELMRNMEGGGPIDLIDRALVIYGNRPHEGHEHRALVVVHLFDGEVTAVNFTQGKYVLYTRKSDDFVSVPRVVWEFIYWDQIEKLIEYAPSKNFEWIKR
jgi:hypothetical protein